ncbi:hypothetical protein LSAT2_028095, partial [Lamellibrachia satsuma]
MWTLLAADVVALSRVAVVTSGVAQQAKTSYDHGNYLPSKPLVCQSAECLYVLPMTSKAAFSMATAGLCGALANSSTGQYRDGLSNYEYATLRSVCPGMKRELVA